MLAIAGVAMLAIAAVVAVMAMSASAASTTIGVKSAKVGAKHESIAVNSRAWPCTRSRATPPST